MLSPDTLIFVAAQLAVSVSSVGLAVLLGRNLRTLGLELDALRAEVDRLERLSAPPPPPTLRVLIPDPPDVPLRVVRLPRHELH